MKGYLPKLKCVASNEKYNVWGYCQGATLISTWTLQVKTKAGVLVAVYDDFDTCIELLERGAK